MGISGYLEHRIQILSWSKAVRKPAALLRYVPRTRKPLDTVRNLHKPQIRFDILHHFGCPDVTPNLHPVAIRVSALFLPMWACEARFCIAEPRAMRREAAHAFQARGEGRPGGVSKRGI